MRLSTKLFTTLFLYATATLTLALELDTNLSKVKWEGKKITGEAHSGEIKVKSGNLELKEGKLIGGNIVIDMTKITVTDLKGKLATKLANHLMNKDFFEVEKHEEAKVVSKVVKKVAEKKYEVKGNLTIKDIEKPASVVLEEKQGAYVGVLVFDRAKFDVRFNSGSFVKDLGDKLILDDVELKISLVVKK